MFFVPLTVSLFLKITLSDHDIDGACATVVTLGRMERQYRFKLGQPFCEVAFELGNAVGVALPFAMKDQHGTNAVAQAVLNKPEELAASLLHRHSMKIQAGLDRVLAQPVFPEHTMLNPGTLPAQDIMGSQRVDSVGRQGILVTTGPVCCRPLPLQMTWRQVPGRLDIGAVGSADPADVLHFFQEIQPFVFGRHGVV
jgi:hypothetical protein